MSSWHQLYTGVTSRGTLSVALSPTREVMIIRMGDERVIIPAAQWARLRQAIEAAEEDAER